MAFLESYVDRFRILVRTGVEVESVRPGGERFVVSGRDQEAGPVTLATRSVVVASGMIHVPKIPALRSDLPADVLQAAHG